MRTSGELLRDFYEVRQERNSLRAERASLLCERGERVAPCDWESDVIQQEEPCWKAARKWEDSESRRARFYFDPPPSKWCESCQRRQVVSDAYREMVRRHGGALRGLLRRGRALEFGKQARLGKDA